MVSISCPLPYKENLWPSGKGLAVGRVVACLVSFITGLAQSEVTGVKHGIEIFWQHCGLRHVFAAQDISVTDFLSRINGHYQVRMRSPPVRKPTTCQSAPPQPIKMPAGRQCFGGLLIDPKRPSKARCRTSAKGGKEA